MPATTLIDRKAAALTAVEKATVKADKAILAVLKSGDASVLNTFTARVAAVANVLNQSGEGQGKRFAGAADHSFEANLNAYASTVTRGNIPTIA